MRLSLLFPRNQRHVDSDDECLVPVASHTYVQSVEWQSNGGAVLCVWDEASVERTMNSHILTD